MGIKVIGNKATNDKNNLTHNNVNEVNIKNIHTTDIIQHSDITGSGNILDDNRTSIQEGKVYQPEIINTNCGNEYICNRQYMMNIKANIGISNSTIDQETTLDPHIPDNFRTNNVYTDVNDLAHAKSINEDHVHGQSNANEMTTTNIHNLPRGIVNPNYPGFQHLAHTLQDYSTTNIGCYEHSENEISDEEADVNYTGQFFLKDQNCRNGNNINLRLKGKSIDDLQIKEMSKLDSNNQVPDLIKTLTENNNNNNDILVSCTATDIENNFNTKDIIGDFNKEIEDEIRQLLNYNINIEDDLQELRKDIKETFAKPIENTINNISDVVNDVIKKLVENDSFDKTDMTANKVDITSNVEDDTVMKKENETNARTELNISRPTFLLIQNNVHSKITDAILSDGKEEINVHNYDTEQLSFNVENTIKQLSTELRKIIPKLNEMRDRDKIWNETNKDISNVTDRNSNNILQNVNVPVKFIDESNWLKKQNNISPVAVTKKSIKNRSETRRQSSVKSMLKVKTNLSVRTEDTEYEESFDVYNIETALPKLDFDAIESHIKAAREAERRKHNDREEIRKRLAMDIETEEYYSLGHTDRPGRKPSLHSRLQNGKNLQICFMNETASDNESQTSETERNLNHSLSQTSLLSKNIYNNPYHTRPLSVNITKSSKISNAQNGSKLRPASLTTKTTKSKSTHSLNTIELKESDFFALQETLQTEARIALAQAKEMARIQMERERAMRGSSPVTEMLRRSVAAARVPLLPPRRRLSRRLLTDVNVAQLQIIVNELHSQIESLNDTLVKLLMARDELHMGQDSMLVDIEDLTRYLGVKEQTKKIKGTNKSAVRRLTSLVHK